jgi:hypothetical protein
MGDQSRRLQGQKDRFSKGAWMPRAKRHNIRGHVWHIMHRSHK